MPAFLPIWGEDPVAPVAPSRMKIRTQTSSFAGQVVAVNALLVVATLFAATAAANLNLELHDERIPFVLLALTILLVLLLNMMMLRRRFLPLGADLRILVCQAPSVTSQITSGMEEPSSNTTRMRLPWL